MSERIDIANLALDWLGESPITSLDDESEKAIKIKNNYIPARDATLEAHEWSFAIKRFIPAKNAVPPVYGAANAFDIPSDILRVIAVEREHSYPDSANFTPRINSREQIDWVYEGRQIICNEEVIYARGIRRIEDEGSFSPLFVQALAAKLAMFSALSITGSIDTQANMIALWDLNISEAKSRDGLQGRARRIRHRTMQKSR